MTEKNTKHGHCRRKQPRTRAYKTWASILRRCYTPSASGYYKYGAKGVTVCDEWKNSFQAFLNDMGEPPEDKSIDRIDNKLGYSKENCRWATIHEQAQNKTTNLKFTIDGETNCLAEWCRIYNISYQAVLGRIHRKWEIKKALTTKLRILNKKNKNI